MACVFCQIAAGQSKSRKVFEDATAVAVLDVFPVTEGHTLVIPKKHYRSVYDVPESEAGHLFAVAIKVGNILEKALKADAINISTAPAAIDHFHIHVVPRYDYDMMGALPDLDNKREVAPKAIDAVHQRITEFLSPQASPSGEEHYKVEVEEETSEAPKRRTSPREEPADETEEGEAQFQA